MGQPGGIIQQVSGNVKYLRQYFGDVKQDFELKTVRYKTAKEGS